MRLDYILKPNKILVLASALAFIVMLGETSQVAAQTMMPIPNQSSVYTGYIRGYWFTAPTDFFMLGVRVPTTASTSQMQIQVMKMAAPPPNYAACTGTFTTLGYWPNVPGTAVIPMKELIRKDEVVAIIGSRWVTAGNFSSINSYAPGGYVSNILGQPVTLYRLLWQGGIMSSPATCISSGGSGSIGRVEMYYGPPCEVPAGSLLASLVDVNGVSQAFSEVPGTVYVKYEVSYPTGPANVSVKLDFYLVGDSDPNPKFSATVTDTKLDGQDLTGIQMVSVPAGVPTGYYRVIPTFNTKNSCDEYEDVELEELTYMLVGPGTTPCIVWPGDVNNDGVVNYGDRKSLNRYIHDANMNTLWLNGPPRYRSDAATNPLTYLEWVAQAAVPWFTPDGCYMDADGNGTINSFDYIGMKNNWMRDHGGGSGKHDEKTNPNNFELQQNFPNPFNPTTQLRYHVPERSEVHIVVLDMLGREVATIVNQTVAEGSHIASFEASGLQSGAYVAVATMHGLENGLTFTKTIRMTLAK